MAEQIITKQCPKCKQIKPLSEFYKDCSTKNGFHTYCKSCVNLYHKTERYKIVMKRYQQSKKGKITMKKADKKTRLFHPNRRKARSAIGHAVEAGIKRAKEYYCLYCPNKADEFHHHKGYAKEHWLDVEPVCIKCHRIIHNC